MSNTGMSRDMYEFIKANIHRINYDLEKGLVITPKGTNGTLCSSTGYLRVRVNNRLLQVHQIMAYLYFGEECIGKQINHDNGDKTNNKRHNLQVCTQLENLKHQREKGLIGFHNHTNGSKVDKLDMEGVYICTYPSILQASIDVDIKSSSDIIYAIKGVNSKGKKFTSAGGFKWRLTPED